MFKHRVNTYNHHHKKIELLGINFYVLSTSFAILLSSGIIVP